MFIRWFSAILLAAATALPAAVIDDSWKIFTPEKATPTEKKAAAEAAAKAAAEKPVSK